VTSWTCNETDRELMIRHEDEHRRYGIDLPAPPERVDRFEEAVELIAALMAQEGVTANPNIIEAKNGFYDTLVGAGHHDAERMAESLGKPFYIESPGIGLKKYPSCYHTHRALDGVFQLLGEHRLSDKDIAEVDVGTSERAMRVLAFTEPATPYQAKFSMPYCIAAAVVDHEVTLVPDTRTSMAAGV